MELAARIGTMARRGAPLPYDAELEWLGGRGSGTNNQQFIDTNILPSDDDTKIIVDFMPTQARGDIKFFGSLLSYGIGYYQDKWRIGFKNWETIQVPSDTSRHTVVYNNGVVTIDGEEVYSGDLLSGNNKYTYKIFATTNNTGSNLCGPCNFYSAIIYRSGTPIIDMIPVRFTNENGESEGAMYNRLGVGGNNPDGSPRNDGLFRNAGTGVFIVGPDVVSSRGGY